MKYASLFSGIGGFETALNKLGFECVFASEIDKYANRAYEILYGQKTAGDITKTSADSIPDHDLLVAGFPCQAFSVAGNQQGFGDTRGTLFFEIERILQKKKPRFILLENVKGLLFHDKGKTFEIILKSLSKIGYTLDYTILNSKFYGVPQNRERLFIVGIFDGLKEAYLVHGSNILVKSKQKINQLEINTFNFPFPIHQEVTTKLRDVLEAHPNEEYYLSEEKTVELIHQLRGRCKSVGSSTCDHSRTNHQASKWSSF